jgi:hypothetical protein
MGKKKAAVHYSLMNDIVLNQVLNLIDENNPGRLFPPLLSSPLLSLPSFFLPSFLLPTHLNAM